MHKHAEIVQDSTLALFDDMGNDIGVSHNIKTSKIVPTTGCQTPTSAM